MRRALADFPAQAGPREKSAAAAKEVAKKILLDDTRREKSAALPGSFFPLLRSGGGRNAPDHRTSLISCRSSFGRASSAELRFAQNVSAPERELSLTQYFFAELRGACQAF